MKLNFPGDLTGRIDPDQAVGPNWCGEWFRPGNAVYEPELHRTVVDMDLVHTTPPNPISLAKVLERAMLWDIKTNPEMLEVYKEVVLFG